MIEKIVNTKLTGYQEFRDEMPLEPPIKRSEQKSSHLRSGRQSFVQSYSYNSLSYLCSRFVSPVWCRTAIISKGEPKGSAREQFIKNRLLGWILGIIPIGGSPFVACTAAIGAFNKGEGRIKLYLSEEANYYG